MFNLVVRKKSRTGDTDGQAVESELTCFLIDRRLICAYRVVLNPNWLVDLERMMLSISRCTIAAGVDAWYRPGVAVAEARVAEAAVLVRAAAVVVVVIGDDGQ